MMGIVYTKNKHPYVNYVRTLVIHDQIRKGRTK
jgi:hypothetical protein